MIKHVSTSLVVLLVIVSTNVLGQTSWEGDEDTRWRNPNNWTNGVPDSSTDAIVGDLNFIGPHQPNLTKSGGVGDCNNLTIGNGTDVLTLETDDALNIAGTLTIGSNGTLLQDRNFIYITGDFVNNGTYTADDNNRRIYMVGTSSTLGGSSTTTFAKLYLNAESAVTLSNNIIINQSLDLSGTFDPTANYTVSGTGDVILRGTGILVVKASTFAGNYTYSGSLTLRSNSTIDYASSAINQTVNSTINYRNLKISGGLVKSLSANTSVRDNLDITAGTLDITTFTIDRSNNGGFLSIAAGATLKIGGTLSFPNNYATHILASTSTVEYNGSNQTITNESYGNLILSSSSGTVTKTMPVDALTIAGNLTSSSTAGSLSFTAGNNINVLGNISIGSNTTFDGSTFSHQVSGDVVNEGIYTGTSSTYTSNGGNATWSGAGTYTMGNMTINGSNTGFDLNTSLSIAGNFVTATSGTVTHTTGGSGTLTMTGASKTISGMGIVFDDLIIASGASVSNGSSYTVAGDITVDGTLTDSSEGVTLSGTSKTISGSGTLQFNDLSISGSITTSRNFSISGNLDVSGSLTASAGTVTFNGTSDLSGTANLFNATVDNASTLSMSVNATLNIAGVDALNGTGTFDGASNTPNTVVYNSSGNQTVNFVTFHHLTVSNGGTKTPAAALTVNGDLTIGATTTLNGSSFTHTLKGDWTNNGSFTASTSTFQLTGTENSTITGATTFNNLTVNKNSTNEVTLANNITASTVNMTGGIIQTGANTLTITNTRTGNGIILGTITRQHSFTTSTDYAFEGPNNTINFSAITGSITSITVNIDNQTLSSFPYRESINRAYDITVGGAVVSYTATLRLHYETEDLNGNNESLMELWSDQGATNWINMGKSTNNTTDNWVEQTGLSSIEDKWSLSDGLKVVSWTGSVSSLTSDAGNWTITAGTPSLPPALDDVVVFGDQTFTNQPTFDASTTVKRIIFESTTATTTTVNSGITVTLTGNLLGDWTGGNATHTVNIGTGTMITNGDAEMSDGTANHVINLNASSGTYTFLGSVQQSGGANITYTGAGSLNIGEDYDYTSGTFTAGTSTVTYNGSKNQTIAGLTYNNLTIDKAAGLAEVNNSLQVLNDLTLTNGVLSAFNDLNIDGDLIISTGTTLNAGSANVNVAGDITQNGTLDPGSSTITFDGTGNQNVLALTYHNLTINKASGTATLLGNVNIKSDVTITNGTIDAGTYNIVRTSSGGTATLGTGTTLLLAGGSNQVQNFTTLSLDPASTVHFNGTIARFIPPLQYGHLIISNGGSNAKSLIGATTVKGDLTINTGSTFDISNYSLSLEGDLTIDGSFTTTSSFVELNGTNKNINGTTTFEDILVNGSYDYQSGNPDFNGNLEVAATGDFDLGSSTVNVYGDLTNRGIAVSNGVVNFMGTQAQTIRLLNAVTSSSSGVINFNGTVAPIFNSTSSPQFATVNINNTAPLTPSAPWTVAISMNIASGATFNGGPLTHTFLGHFVNNGTVTSDGNMNFSPIYFPTAITLGNNFTSTGIVTLGGNQATTLTDNTPNFTSVTISNSNAAGITAGSAWAVSDNFLITSGATYNAGSFTHTISGDFNNQGTLDGETSTIVFDGATGSNSIGGGGTTSFNNITFDTGSILEVTSSIEIAGNFINSGTSLDLSTASVEFNGSTLSVLSGSVPTFNDVTINKSAGNVRMDVNATINNTLALTAGLLQLNGYELSVTNSLASAISRTAGMVVSENTDNSSKVNWTIGTDADEHIIPFGTASSDYIPFSFDLASGDAGVVSVSTYPTGTNNLPLPAGVTNIDADGNNNSSHTVDRFFQIDLAGQTSPNATIQLTATSGEVGSISNLMGQRWDGIKWEAALPGQTNTATSVTIPNVTQFSPWAMSGNGMPLPVELTSFEAQIVNGNVELDWSTATETNNEGFIIQQSMDGKSFDEIDFVTGNGTSNNVIDYNYVVRNPVNGMNYYRLKQMDYDGQFEFSSILAVKVNLKKAESFSFFPNPSNGSDLKLETHGIMNDEVELSLLDFQGKAIWQKRINVSSLNALFDLDIDKTVKSGMYLMRITTRNETKLRKIVIEN